MYLTRPSDDMGIYCTLETPSLIDSDEYSNGNLIWQLLIAHHPFLSQDARLRVFRIWINDAILRNGKSEACLLPWTIFQARA